MIRGIGHAAFVVRDVEQTLRFYCAGLGLEEAFRLEDEGGILRSVYLKIGPGQFLELFPPGEGSRPGSEPLPRGHFRHLCLVVDDLASFAEELRRRGITPVTELKRGRRDGNWQLFVEDPDGNRVELMQIDPESPQARAG